MTPKMLLATAGLLGTLAATSTLGQTSLAPIGPSAPQVAQCEAIGIPVDVPPGVRRPEGAGGPLVITATFGAGFSAAQMAVIQQAINDWQAIVQDSGTTPNPYTITFNLKAFGAGDNRIAVTGPAFNAQTGDLINANMDINTNFTFFVDPTPANDSEFTGPNPPAGIDLLTVMRHEIGHALGWIQSPRFTGHVAANVFDAPRLNAAIDAASGNHVDAAWLANDIMVPGIGASTRRPISLYPSGAVVARGYGYRIPMQFVDPNHAGTETGTANEPWRTLQTALASGPGFTPLLLANLTHHVPVGFIGASNHEIQAARGGAIVVAP